MKIIILLMRIVVLSCIFCIITLCSNVQKKETETASKVIKVDMNSKITENFQDIIYSMNMLKLEESDEYPIGEIKKLILTNRNIYILDQRRSKSVFIYNRDGKLENVIHRVGPGPGEYITSDDMNLDKESNNIVILDGSARKLLFYSEKGQFRSDLKLDFFVNTFFIKNNNFILDKGNTVYKITNFNYIIIKNRQGDDIANLLPIPDFLKEMTIVSYNPLQEVGDTVLYMPSLNNAIYKIYDNKIEKKYQIDFGTKWPGRNFFESRKNDHIAKIANDITSGGYVSFLNFLESNAYLHLNFYYNDSPVWYFYNKTTGQSIMFRNTNKDVSQPLAVDGNTFICVRYLENSNPTLVFFDLRWE